MPDDDNQQENAMTTKPEWFIKFENMQEQRWKRQREFNQQILSLVQSLVKRIDNLVVKNNLKSSFQNNYITNYYVSKSSIVNKIFRL